VKKANKVNNQDTEAHAHEEKPPKDMEKVVIADITFSFNNSELIKCLRARGRNISLQKFDEVRAEEKKIQAIIENWQTLTRPTAAFITFEEEDAFLLAIEEAEKNEKLPED